MYAYLHEELVNALLSKPELRKESVLIDQGGRQSRRSRESEIQWSLGWQGV